MNGLRVVGVALLACGLSVSRVSAADDVQAKLDAGKGLLAAGKCEEAIKAFQEVIADKTATIEQESQAQLNIGYGYRYLGKHKEAITEFRKVMENYHGASLETLAEAQLYVGYGYRDLGKHEEAITEFRKVMENYHGASLGDLAEAQRHIGLSYRSLAKHEEAITEFRKAIENYPGAPLDTLVDVQFCIGLSYRDLGKHEEAITEFRKVMDKYPGARGRILADAGTCVGDSYAELGKWPEAVQAYAQAIKLCPSPEVHATLRAGLSKVVGAPASTVRLADVTRDLRSVMLANPGDRPTCEAIQSLIVDLLLDQGQFDAALAEARTLMQVSTPDNLVKAGERLAMALKGTDGNLVRVNQFIKYQKWGRAGEDGQAGTADDLTDPLGSVTFPASEERDKQFSEALAKLPKDWTGRLARANLFRYWGKPREALKELKMAFALCPADQQALQNTTDGITQVLSQLSGDPKTGERFVAFLNHGTAGADGKQGTEDDLTNPLLDYAKE